MRRWQLATMGGILAMVLGWAIFVISERRGPLADLSARTTCTFSLLPSDAAPPTDAAPPAANPATASVNTAKAQRAASAAGYAEVSLSREQAGNAATIVDVALRRGLPERASVIALATAVQESRLRNLDYGDRDSLGLFQQRPSQGWGTPAQVQNPVYAAEKFYDGLVKVRGYQELPLTVAAQAVQRSALPDAYAAHEPEATVLAGAMYDPDAATITCPVETPQHAREVAPLRCATARSAEPTSAEPTSSTWPGTRSRPARRACSLDSA